MKNPITSRQLTYNFLYTALCYVVAMTIRDALLCSLQCANVDPSSLVLGKWLLAILSLIACLIFINISRKMFNMDYVSPNKG
jgi:hypothetical protein